jgi:RNA polymerase sigma-70 factor, ECF subfamily
MLDPRVPTRNFASCASAEPLASAGVRGGDATPDLLLIERARGGERPAVEALVRRYGRRLFRVAWSVLLDSERAQAAVLEACAGAFGDLSRYEPNGRFATWLTRLTYQQARALREPASGAGRTGAPRPVDTDETQSPEAAIARLPEPFRTVYVLRVIEGVSGIETAACLGLHVTTVRTRLYRAHRRLGPELAQHLKSSPAVLEPSPESLQHLAQRAAARLSPGSVLKVSAAST